MQIFNFAQITVFLTFLTKLPRPRLIFASLLFLLALFYPGQNSLQTITIKPGPIESYLLPPYDPAPYPKSDGTLPPYISATGVIVQDVDSKTILYEYGPDLTLLPASTTKLMTALVVLENYDLEEVVTISLESDAIGHTMGLEDGESITILSLLYGLLVESGNDAALALANHYPGGYTSFIKAMNDKAAALSLSHTTYKNPSGVESYGHLTTARDLAVLAAYIAQFDLLKEITSTKEITITDVTGQITHDLVNTNELLGELVGVKGMKTGWTEHAGECLVTYVEREGRGVILVVLGSLDRFGDTTRLIDWVYSHHTWISVDN